MSTKPYRNLSWFSLFAILISLLAACGTTPTSPTTSNTPAASTPTSSASTPNVVLPTTTPTGATTTGNTSPAGNSPLSTVHMLDTLNGWALNSSVILKTSDGGLHWKSVSPAQEQLGPLTRGDFMDSQHAWIVTMQGSTITILRTTNGGQSWHVSTINGSGMEVIDAPHFIDTQQGWLELAINGGPGAGSESVGIFHTTDGGQTWSLISSTDDPHSGLPRGGLKTGISFEDALNGWAAGEDASENLWLYVSHDGGKTWHKQLLPELPGSIGTSQTQVHFTTTPPVFFGQVGLLPVMVDGQLDSGPQSAVHGFLLYTTSDGGQSWTSSWMTNPFTLTNFQPPSQADLYIATPEHAWAANPQDSSLYTTADAGQSWQKLSPKVSKVTFIDFLDASNGWLMTASGLLRTSDGGQSWQHINYAYQQ